MVPHHLQYSSRRWSRHLTRHNSESSVHVQQLEALHEAALILTAELDLENVLQKVVDLSCWLVRARYGILSVLAEDGESPHPFAISGLPPEAWLDLPLQESYLVPTPETVPDSDAPGTSANQPAIHSLLAVPIPAKGKIIGGLFLADKINDENGEVSTLFSAQDREILTRFAAQAAIVIENARIYHKTEETALSKERERFGRDLHDGIIQSIYAIGLLLDDSQQRVERDPQIVREQIEGAIHDLNNVMLDIRSYIFNLCPHRFPKSDLRQGIEALVCELRADPFLDVMLQLETIETGLLSTGEVSEILHIAQEALTNAYRHALATQVSVCLQRKGNHLLLAIEDNGIGFDVAAVTSAGGLHNMRQRARALNGQIQIESAKGDGACVRLTLPICGDRPGQEMGRLGD
jgi:signal transduction histidine kinase